MERIILIETSTALCSVALTEGGAVTAYRESSEPKAHASLTAVFVQEVLAEGGVSLSDCDAVCVSMPCGLVLYHRAVLMHAAMAGLA